MYKSPPAFYNLPRIVSRRIAGRKAAMKNVVPDDGSPSFSFTVGAGDVHARPQRTCHRAYFQLREATKSDGVLPGSRTQRWKLPGITAVTPFSRGGRDYYFQSVFADFASLVFVALSYQYAVNGDNEALVQTYNQGLFPIDYVLAITVVIALIVADRIIYLNKAKAAKVAYHFLTYAAF